MERSYTQHDTYLRKKNINTYLFIYTLILSLSIILPIRTVWAWVLIWIWINDVLQSEGGSWHSPNFKLIVITFPIDFVILGLHNDITVIKGFNRTHLGLHCLLFLNPGDQVIWLLVFGLNWLDRLSLLLDLILDLLLGFAHVWTLALFWNLALVWTFAFVFISIFTLFFLFFLHLLFFLLLTAVLRVFIWIPTLWRIPFFLCPFLGGFPLFANIFYFFVCFFDLDSFFILNFSQHVQKSH